MGDEPDNQAAGTCRTAAFSLAANYDPDLIPALADYPVEEVYGKFPADGISGGRPRYLATPLSAAELERYIKLGIEFDTPIMIPGGHCQFIAQEEARSGLVDQIRPVAEQVWAAGLLHFLGADSQGTVVS